MTTTIEITNTRKEDRESITLEQYLKRKIQRRRRVAKRLLKRFPLIAVEIMQNEFPGYTYDEFIADVTRKTRKGKSYRRPKTKAFDWDTIRREIPDFFTKCIERRKTTAKIRGRLSNGKEFTCIVRASYPGEYGEGRLRTGDLVKLWRGTLKDFLKHPAVLVMENNNQLV